MARLTEANYLSRRVKLLTALEEARQAHSDIAFRREMDEATDPQVRAARDAVVGFEERIVALDGAWERTQALVAAEAAAVEIESAAEAHAVVLDLLKRRNEIAAEMEDAAQALALSYSEYAVAGAQVKEIALAHRSRFSQDLLGHVRDLLEGPFHDIRAPLARVIGSRGLDLTGHAFHGYATDHPHQRSVRVFADWQNTRVAQHAQALLPQENVA